MEEAFKDPSSLDLRKDMDAFGVDLEAAKAFSNSQLNLLSAENIKLRNELDDVISQLHAVQEELEKHLSFTSQGLSALEAYKDSQSKLIALILDFHS